MTCQSNVVGNVVYSDRELTRIIDEKMTRGETNAAIDIIRQIPSTIHREFYETFYATRFLKEGNLILATTIIEGMQEGRARDHWHGMLEDRVKPM